MTAFTQRFADAAEALIGSPYRLYGRNPSTGLDCVGFVLSALAVSGRTTCELPSYGLRNIGIARHLMFAEKNGFSPATGACSRGDLVLVEPGPGQHHLLVALGRNRFAHAHAGARKALCQTGLASWSLTAHWRPLDLD